MFTDPFPAVAPNYSTSPIQSLILGIRKIKLLLRTLSLLNQNGISLMKSVLSVYVDLSKVIIYNALLFLTCFPDAQHQGTC